MAESSLSILQHEGDKRGDAADFDEHIAFYKGALRITRTVLTFLAVLLISMYVFLVR